MIKIQQLRSPLVGLAILFALSLSLTLLSLRFAPLPQLGFAQDIGIMLDAGWRYTQGQMPHRDYVSPLGPAYAMMVGIPLKLGGVEYSSYRVLPILIACVFMLAAFAVAWGRLPAWADVMYSILVGAVAGGTYHMGWPAEWTSFATFFNRQGWAAVMILAVGFCLPSLSSGKIADTFAGIISGALLGVLLFWKINFFMAGALVVAVGLLLRVAPLGGRLAVVAGASFLVTCLFLLQSISWDVGGMIRDLTYAAEARRLSFAGSELYWNPGTKLVSNALGLTLVCSFCAAATIRRKWRAFAITAFLGLLGYGLMNTNSSGNGAGIPLIVTALMAGAVLTFGAGVRSDDNSRSNSAAVVLAWGTAVAVGLSTLLIPQIISWGVWAAASEAIRQKQFPTFTAEAGSMAGFSENGNNEWREQFSTFVKEGTSLIQENVKDDETLLYVDFTNLFNFAAKARSPRHTMLWIDFNGTFARTEIGHPKPEVLFSDVDYVMLPKKPFGPDVVNSWLELYRGYLNAHYRPSVESPNFWLFSKNSPRG